MAIRKSRWSSPKGARNSPTRRIKFRVLEQARGDQPGGVAGHEDLTEPVREVREQDEGAAPEPPTLPVERRQDRGRVGVVDSLAPQHDAVREDRREREESPGDRSRDAVYEIAARTALSRGVS